MPDIVPGINGSAEFSHGQMILPRTFHLINTQFEPWCTEAFRERTGTETEHTEAEPEAAVSSSLPALELSRVPGLPEEGYRLTIRESGIRVEAGTERGVIQALTTAACLLNNGRFPCCRIEDAPEYPHRGVMLDCARHFFSAAEVRRVIEGISLAKLNVLHWHLSDDQGWRMESRHFPKLQQVSGDFYTQQEIREIVEYARVRGVEILPEVDMPGHMTALLAAYPQYSCSGKTVTLAKSGGIYPVILCPGKEETYAMLETLLDEIVPLFPGPRFHIGGDEAPKMEWETCPDCRRRMQEQSLADTCELQGYFTGRVTELLKKYGKQAVCWNETLDAACAPRDIQIQYWTLDHRTGMEPFLAQGGRWIYSDMFELYLDYPAAMTPLSKVYQTEPHLGTRTCGKQDGLRGMECCLWTEHIIQNEALEENLFPRVYALAERCWCRKKDYKAFEQRLKSVPGAEVFRNVHCAPEDRWNPQGKARREEALDYFHRMNEGMDPEVRKQTVQASRPSREFGENFMKKFFHPTDLPFLMKAMNTKKQ